MKKILINGAGRGCLNLTKTAKRMGLYVVVTGMDGPCIPLADVAYREVHPGHPDEVLNVAKIEHVDAIATCCNDLGLASVGYCCDQLHLSGISYEAAKLSSDKFLMKERLYAHNVRTAKYKKVFSYDELKLASSELHFPIIIKATDLQGSRGINIVCGEDEMKAAYKDTMSLTHKDYCIVEEFIEGKEFGAQAFVYKGEVLFVLPHGDETIMSNTAVPVGHYMPYLMNEELSADVQSQARNAIMALGLDNCAVNIDFIERDNKAYVIELTGRGGANGLTDMVGKYYGINYYEMIIEAALEGTPGVIFSKRKSTHCATISKMLTSEKSGIVKSVTIPTLQDIDITMFVSEGSEVRAFANSNDDIGQIVVSAVNLEECQCRIEKALNSLKVELI